MSVSLSGSAVENRKRQITQQLDHLRSQRLRKGLSHYANENVYRRQLKRSQELISELEDELLILNCPGEYDELPVAIVADELELKYERVRGLIKLGEITATGKMAHERISRKEIERITLMGVSTLLRLSKQASAEIFEQGIQYLQRGDLEAAERTYRRLNARESWRGPFTPSFLVGFELASGNLYDALSSVKIIFECEDLLLRIAIMTYLRRLLQSIHLKENGSQELCNQLIKLTEDVATKCELLNNKVKPS